MCRLETSVRSLDPRAWSLTGLNIAGIRYVDTCTESLLSGVNHFRDFTMFKQVIFVLCPSLATILTNTYREDSKLYIDGSFILSQDGTTQGDPLAMPMYALGIVPLIQQLAEFEVSQMWYADDASAGGSFLNLSSWWDYVVRL